MATPGVPLVYSDPFGMEDEDLAADRGRHKLRSKKFGVDYLQPPQDYSALGRDASSGRDLPTGVAPEIMTDIDPFSKDERLKRVARDQKFGRADRIAWEGSEEGAGGYSSAAPMEAEQSGEDNGRKGTIVRPTEAGPDAAVGLPERSEALHLSGVGSMNSEEVLACFSGCAPRGIEWMTDDSCNVVFEDTFSARRALLGKGVRGAVAGAWSLGGFPLVSLRFATVADLPSGRVRKAAAVVRAPERMQMKDVDLDAIGAEECGEGEEGWQHVVGRGGERKRGREGEELEQHDLREVLRQRAVAGAVDREDGEMEVGGGDLREVLREKGGGGEAEMAMAAKKGDAWSKVSGKTMYSDFVVRGRKKGVLRSDEQGPALAGRLAGRVADRVGEGRGGGVGVLKRLGLDIRAKGDRRPEQAAKGSVKDRLGKVEQSGSKRDIASRLGPLN